MIPGTYALNLYRGDSAHWKFVLWSDEAKTLPVDLIGATAAAEIKDRPNGVVVGEMVCTIVVPNIVDVMLPASVAEGLPPTGLWDLQITLATGEVFTPVAGQVKVALDVTIPASP